MKVRVRADRDSRSGESHRLHHKSTVILIELRWTFSMPENRLKPDVSAVVVYSKPRCRAILQRGFVRFTFVSVA